MAPRLSGQNCKFFKFLLSLNSQKRLEYKENNTKYRSLTRKPRSHVRILIYRTWPRKVVWFFIHSTFNKITPFPWKLGYSCEVQFGINCTDLDQTKLSNFVECTIRILNYQTALRRVQITPKANTNIYIFSQVSERAGFLNLRIWLANHAHVTGPAFYDTTHGPDFFPAQRCTKISLLKDSGNRQSFAYFTLPSTKSQHLLIAVHFKMARKVTVSKFKWVFWSCESLLHCL